MRKNGLLSADISFELRNGNFNWKVEYRMFNHEFAEATKKKLNLNIAKCVKFSTFKFVSLFIKKYNGAPSSSTFYWWCWPIFSDEFRNWKWWKQWMSSVVNYIYLEISRDSLGIMLILIWKPRAKKKINWIFVKQPTGTKQ